MDISCYAPCTENEPSPLEPWNMPTPSDGDGIPFVTVLDSTSIKFTGDGTDANPLSAAVEGDIEFEISTSRLAGFGPDELIFAYATAKGFTLRSGLPGATVASRASDDLRVNIYREQALIGYVEIVGGTPSFSFGADVVFAPNDLLEYRSVDAATFDLLAITLVGERELTFV